MTKVFLLLLILISFSCKKEIAEFNPDFVGDWHINNPSYPNNRFAHFNINSNSYGVLEYGAGDRGKDEVIGTVKIDGDKLKMGWRGFSIIKYPTKLDYTHGRDTIFLFYGGGIATWEMEIKSLSIFYPRDTWVFYR